MLHLRAASLFAIVFGLLAVLFASACAPLQPSQVDYLNRQLGGAAAAADRNNDGQVTNREVRATANDPNFWLSVASGVLGFLGIGAGAAALKKGGQIERETDEQWDMHSATAVELAELRAAAAAAAPSGPKLDTAS